VNLVLRVGPPRADGYHDVLSLMVPLDLGDRVEVEVSARAGAVSCRVPGRPELDGEGNLAARAALAFRERFGPRRGVRIRIEKRIPVTAGLGGGSSDAAAVLRCLAVAFGVRDRTALSEVGLSVGSDVPFFLGRGAAWARGRGERLTPAEVPPLDLLLAYPRDAALAIRAGDAYRWLDASRRDGAPRSLGRPSGYHPARVGNDLQAPCVAHHPALVPLLGRLMGAGALAAIMSGSGPTVFGVFSGRSAARAAALSIAAVAAGREDAQLELLVVRTVRGLPRVTPWRSPRSASSRSTRTSSRPT
jgi:4-diphosphocytidyl-2-C-methyl-D-erythritol kinase